MRLGQLARKLALRPAEIVEFLAMHHIQIEEGSNTRIEDEHVSLIMTQFAPERLAEVNTELAAEKELQQLSEVPPQPRAVSSEVKSAGSVSAVTENLETPAPIVEVIKAPKIELSGLKVLGKIELPEPKKKEQQSVESDQQLEGTAPAEAQKKVKPERKPFAPRRERHERPLKNPVALQREREAMEAEKRRKANAEREKEKRTQNYLKKVKTPAPTKAAKIVKEQVEVMKEEKVDPPKTWLGRFIRWMNT